MKKKQKREEKSNETVPTKWIERHLTCLVKGCKAERTMKLPERIKGDGFLCNTCFKGWKKQHGLLQKDMIIQGHSAFGVITSERSQSVEILPTDRELIEATSS